MNQITADGAANVEFQNQLTGNYLDMELTGASTFRGSVSVDELVANLDGAGKMEISGSSNSFDINADGASEMSDFDFATNTLNANLDGGCNISLTVNQKLNVKATGASNVYYKGNGVIESQNLSGASKIVKMD